MFINVKKLNSKAKLPERATATSAGADLCACIDDNVVLMPGDRKLIPTGLAIAVPTGYGGVFVCRGDRAVLCAQGADFPQNSAFRLQTASALSTVTTGER